MELDLLQILGGFGGGIVVGIVGMLIFNKVRSGSTSAGGVKQDFDAYKTEVEEHFEATSKKFQNMTEQYQDLYQHLSVGATTLCRSDSVAAALVDGSNPEKPAQIEDSSVKQEMPSEPAEANDDSNAVDSDKVEEDAEKGVEKDAEASSESKPKPGAEVVDRRT